MAHQVAENGMIAWYECDGCGFRVVSPGESMACPRCTRPFDL